MWTLLTSWFTVAVVVPVLITIGLGVLSMNPPEYIIAYICFTVTALLLLARTGWWLAFEQSGSKVQVVLFAFVILGSISALWSISMKWVKEREHNFLTPTSKTEQPPAEKRSAAPVAFKKHIPQLVPPSKQTEQGMSKSIVLPQENRFPLVDVELERVKAEDSEVQFAYDIFVHNKSNVTISQIHILRMINPEKNKQRIAVHERPQTKLAPFQEQINVLSPDERRKIRRERSPSYEYAVVSVIYGDDSGKRYKCIFEGDRDGLRLTDKSLIATNSSQK
ncbi:MAG: hypothetical protein HY742_09445 [Deltaproteobacteria bacterium]|nr:hypothetical protein [Deltaproteobacteria bacterium]